jgi:hypothetical protein
VHLDVLRDGTARLFHVLPLLAGAHTDPNRHLQVKASSCIAGKPRKQVCAPVCSALECATMRTVLTMTLPLAEYYVSTAVSTVVSTVVSTSLR